MNEPIYKLFLARPKPEWCKLSKKEQEAYLEKLQASIGKVGGKIVIYCDSSWSNEQWPIFGIEEYPNLDAVRKHAELHAELHWPYEFLDAFSILGTKSE